MSKYQQTYRQTESGAEKFKTYQKAYRTKKAQQETPAEREQRLQYQKEYRLRKKQELLALPQEEQQLIKERQKRYKSEWSMKRHFYNNLKKLETETDDDEISISDLLEKFNESSIKNN
jgi:hypothetical protein